MTKNELQTIRNIFYDRRFYTDIFSKPIWGDMGEDCASVYIRVVNNMWHIHFIRTQSGEPLPLSETVCNVIDEYEKDLNDDELYDFLSLHSKLKEFEEFSKEESFER